MQMVMARWAHWALLAYVLWCAARRKQPDVQTGWRIVRRGVRWVPEIGAAEASDASR
jgi:hypothetical protein